MPLEGIQIGGLYVRLPNQKVFMANTTKFMSNVARRFEYFVGIRYSNDVAQAIKIIKDLIEAQPMALKNQEPKVFDNLGDNSVDIIIRICGWVTEWFGLRNQLLWKIRKTLESKGIEIPFPQRVLWFANELRGAVTAEIGAG